MIELHQVLLGCMILFAIGATIVLVRRELLYMLMGIEVMFNAGALAALAAGQHWAQAQGQIFVVVIMSVTAAELVVALILIWLCYRHYQISSTEALTMLSEVSDPATEHPNMEQPTMDARP